MAKEMVLGPNLTILMRLKSSLNLLQGLYLEQVKDNQFVKTQNCQDLVSMLFLAEELKEDNFLWEVVIELKSLNRAQDHRLITL